MDANASEQSIKVAYRQLARENHPDLVQGRGADAVAQASALMLRINEAYRVLSNKHLRREYDKSLTSGATFVETMHAAPSVESAAAAAPARSRPVGFGPGHDVADSIVGGFANAFKKDMTAAAGNFKWSDVKLEGFDWASSASFWTSQYILAMRGFAKADLPSAKKFSNYCDLAIESSAHPLKKTYFLFFFAFQKASDQQVPLLLRRFCANENGERSAAPACVVLLDAVRRKSLLLGPLPDDDRYAKMLKGLGLARS